MRNLFVLLLLVTAVTACSRTGNRDGQLESIGREVDDALNDTTQKPSVGDSLGNSIKDLGDSIEDRS